MANVITEKTVCRALQHGLAKELTCESFARVGADYRSVQNSTSNFQKLMNWLAQLIDKDYATRTVAEIEYKRQALQDGFMDMAEQVLKAKVAIDGTVHINFKIGGEPIEIHSFPANPGKLFVRHLWKDTELEQIHLKGFKEVLLKQYLQLKRAAQENSGEMPAQIDLTAFDLTGFDLRDMDLRNCALPDLVRCKLTDMQFDDTTTFKKRQMCEIDDATFDRLQEHRLAQSIWASRDNPIEARLIVTAQRIDETPIQDISSESPPVVMAICVDEMQSVSKYNLGQIFSSDNPDLASIKRKEMQYNPERVKICFKEMRQWGYQINLAHVDLSGLHLEGMDLQGVNMVGADLTGTWLDNANLMSVDLRGATLDKTFLRDAKLKSVKMHQAKITSMVIRKADQRTVARYIFGGEYDKNNLVTFRGLHRPDTIIACRGN